MPHIALTRPGGSYRRGGTPLVDRRVSERDLQAYPELREIAKDYLKDYTGDWEVLVAAQETMHDLGFLPDPVAKLVLNAAYSDPTVRFKLDDDKRPSESNVIELPHARPAPDPGEAQRPQERRSRIRLPAKVKASFGVSSYNGSVLHRVAPHIHYVEWRSSWERLHRFALPDHAPRDKQILVVAWKCSGRADNPMLFAERPEDFPYCRSGCWTTYCPRCETRNVRPNDLEPFVPYPCSKCGETLT